MTRVKIDDLGFTFLGRGEERNQGESGKVLVDGHDVSKLVAGYEIRHDPGDVPRITLEVLPRSASPIDCEFDGVVVYSFAFVEGMSDKMLQELQQTIDSEAWRRKRRQASKERPKT